MLSQLYLIRHGETPWSLIGRHTSRTEVALTPKGEADARQLATRLSGVNFNEVFTSPRLRARQTCELAGFGHSCIIEPDLTEWDYGDYEGLRSTEILESFPGWNIYRNGCPNGESPTEMAVRVDRLIAKLRARDGIVAVFSHGHFGRVLATRWIGAPFEDGKKLPLDPASVSVLCYALGDPAKPVIVRWNETLESLAQ